MSVTFYLLRIGGSGGELIRRDTFFGGGEEMRKCCNLPYSDPFFLSLKLIGVARPAFHVAHQIVSDDNKDFPCCFIKKSKGIYAFGPSNQYHSFCLNSTKWQLVCTGNPSMFCLFPGVRLTGIQSVRHCNRFVNSKLPIFI